MPAEKSSHKRIPSPQSLPHLFICRMQSLPVLRKVRLLGLSPGHSSRESYPVWDWWFREYGGCHSFSPEGWGLFAKLTWNVWVQTIFPSKSRNLWTKYLQKPSPPHPLAPGSHHQALGINNLSIFPFQRETYEDVEREFVSKSLR